MEKRKSPRIRSSALVSLKVESARLSVGSRVKDISEIGICIPSKTYFPVEAMLELEIRSDDLNEPIKIMAKVVRIINRDKGKFPYELGLVLLELPIDKRNILHDYICRLIAQGGQEVSWLD